MKKTLSKVMALFLCAMTGFTVGCKGGSQDESWVGGNPIQSGGSLYEEEEKVFEKTNYKLVNRGVTEYKIVTSDTPTALETMAASELSYFLREATGATLNTIKSSDWKAGTPAISIGDTVIARNAGVSLPTDVDFGTSGYLIKTVEDSIIIMSGERSKGEGCLYGVYDFLGDAVGYECYSEDEFGLDKKNTVELYKYDNIVLPTFDQRSIGYRSTITDMTYQRRMRLIHQRTDNRWGLEGHVQAGSNNWSILPYNVYSVPHDPAVCEAEDESTCAVGHPDWYAGGGTHLCWTAGEDMEKTFATRLYSVIVNNPYSEYFHFGQEDNEYFCACQRCQEAMEEWGMNNQGLQINWANGVVKYTEELRLANEETKNRNVQYMIYAYGGTMDAPTVKQADGTFKPKSDKVIPHEKLYIWFTPISTDFSKSLTHSNNLTVYEALQGYGVLCKGRILVYIYDINFYNYLVNFNNFSTVKGMYEEYKANGVYYMYSQGPMDAVVPTLQEMRIYVESELMWDVSQDYDTLVRKFMVNYFREGAQAMYQYYNLIRNRYAYYQGIEVANIGSIYSDIGNSNIWTEPVVSALSDCINDALKAIEPLRETDAELYNKVKNRIMKENISVLFLTLTHHASYYSNEEVAQMKADLKHYTTLFGVTATRENGSLAGLFD